MILCVYCGNEMEDEARVCPSCGKEVELPEDEQTALEPEAEDAPQQEIDDSQSVTRNEEEEQANVPAVEEDLNSPSGADEAEPEQEDAEGEAQADADAAIENGEATDGMSEGQAGDTESAGKAEEEAPVDSAETVLEEETAESAEPATEGEPALEESAGVDSGEATEEAGPAESEEPLAEELPDEQGEHDTSSVLEDADVNSVEDNPSEMEAAAEMAIRLDEPVAMKQKAAEGGATMSLARAVGALVCGIAGVGLCLVPVAGLVLSIIAMALGAKARAHTVNQRRGIAVAGFVLGVVGLVVSIGALIWWIVVLTSGAKVFWLLGSLV